MTTAATITIATKTATTTSFLLVFSLALGNQPEQWLEALPVPNLRRRSSMVMKVAVVVTKVVVKVTRVVPKGVGKVAMVVVVVNLVVVIGLMIEAIPLLMLICWMT